MVSRDDARRALLDQLPARVRDVLDRDDAVELEKILSELTDEEAARVRDVIRELSLLPERMPIQPDESLGPAGTDSPDAELQDVHDLPEAPALLFRLIEGEPVRPPREWAGDPDRSEGEVPAGSVLFPVWFGTTRKPRRQGQPEAGFGGDRDEPNQVHYGVARVLVPATHQSGSLGTYWLKRWLWTWQDDRVVLRQIEGRSEPEFWEELRAKVEELATPWEGGPTPGRQVLLFVHGFNVSFAQAVVRTAQLGYDLAFPGVTACFSWPSRGSFWSYNADEAACEPSVPALVAFLRRLLPLVGPGRVHLMTHSMGNRVVLRALEQLAWEARSDPAAAPDRRLGNILLHAPDVDRDLFRILAPSCLAVGGRQTNLYVSRRDRAVSLSRWLHSYDRAGFHPPVTLVPGMATVDVSHGDITSHTFYAEERRVLFDMTQILHFDAAPDDPRRRLLRVGGGAYWELL